MYSGDENDNSADEFETTEEEVEEEEDEEEDTRDEYPEPTYRDSQGFTESERQNIIDAGRGHLLR